MTNTSNRHAAVQRHWVVDEWADGEWRELGYVETTNNSMALALARSQLDADATSVLRATQMKES